MDTNGGVGPEVIFWSCHARDASNLKSQQFTYHGGLSQSKSATAAKSTPLCVSIASPVALPKVRVRNGAVSVSGCSNGADFALQLHVTYSSLIDGACIFNGQPFHCAATRFAADELAWQSNSSSVP